VKARPRRTFSLESRAGIKIGIEIGNSRNGKSKVFPSEYIIILEINEPAKERSITPTIRIRRSSKISTVG
jgi:hypothetical protein